ncbi:MAG: alpha/beta hydrolase [Bacteroidota bacterium]
MKYAFLLLLFAMTCQPDVEELVIPTHDYDTKTIVYNELDGVDPNLLSLDIYYNRHLFDRKPIVIWVHGGGWRTGDKKNQIARKVELFQSLDYLFVSINYRLSTSTITDANAVRFPDHNVDLANAIKWVYENAEIYGGDPNKIALMGHSAGGHLVSLTGTNHTFLNQIGLDTDVIKGIASIDTEGYNVVDQIERGNAIYLNAFGDDLVANRAASPIYNVTDDKRYPPFFIAKRGSRRRLAMADAFITALESKGTIVQQVNIQNYDHAGINRAIGAANESYITPPLIEFFESCFD